MGSLNEAVHPAGLHRLPLRMRDPHSLPLQKATNLAPKDGSPGRLKHYPESLHLPLNGSARIRSPTESSMSTLSSVPDSATTTGSISTVASPISSSYAGDLQELFPGSRPASRILHRHQASSGTCSTFVNDEDDGPVISAYPSFKDKIHHFAVDDVRPDTRDGEETLPVSPSTEAPPIEEEQPEPRLTFYEESPPCETPPPPPSKWETISNVSDDCSTQDADSILDYTLQLAYGVDIHDTSVCPAQSRQLVQKFVRELGQTIWQATPDSQITTATMSYSSSSTPGNSGTGESQRGGKRKKQNGNNGNGRGNAGDEEGDDFSDGDGEGCMPIKRPRPNPKEEENLRLSCPFRKRNPQRFNVRDHHSCAMTFFPKMAELRQHIVKQHKRDDPSAFVCDRCNRDFATRKELRDHQRLPRELICEISDHDPESGIDGPTSTKLLSRKRASGSSPEVQWREIWNILFPDDEDHDIPPYHFTPVIEHFELSNSYLAAFDFLRSSLRDKMSNPATLETLATKFHQCFVEAIERCISDAQIMPYANRSNKRGEQLAAATAAAAIQPRKPQDVLPRPDSGVVLNDDGSDESGSVMGSSVAHRESVRTVKSANRNSNLSSNRDIAPARTSSVVFDPHFNLPPASTSTPMTMSSGSIAPADVQAWNQDVMFHGMPPENFVVRPEDLNLLPQDLSSWPHSFYDNSTAAQGMGTDFSGFH